jgi:hypothetical protein
MEAWEVLMHGYRRFIYVLILFIVLTGCQAVPTPSSTPSATQTPTPTATGTSEPTSSPTATATPMPYPVLKSGFLDYICIGLVGYNIRAMAGLPEQSPQAPNPTVYALEGGGTVRFTYKTNLLMDTEIVTSIEVEGKEKIVPIPDSEPVYDYRVAKGEYTFEVGVINSIAAILEGLGTPFTDKTVKEIVIFDEMNVRTIRFEGLTLVLRQDLSPENPDLWFVVLAEITSGPFTTTRGLQVGQPAKEALRLFSTGGFTLGFSPKGTSGDTVQMKISNFTDAESLYWHGGENGGITLDFDDTGRVTAIRIKQGRSGDV